MKKHNVVRAFLIFSLVIIALLMPAIAWGPNVPEATRELYRRYPHLQGARPSQPGQREGSDQSQSRARQEQEHHRREEEQKAQMLKEAEAKEEARRLAEEARIARIKFEKDKEEVLNNFKGVNAGTLTLKGRKNTLGLKRNANPDVILKLPGKDTKRITTAWKQLYHGAWISGFAFKAAKKGDWQETAYLAGQAAKAMNGRKIAVQCPEVPAPTKPYAQLNLGRDSKVTQFYQTLLRSTEEQSRQVESAQKQIREATVKQQMAQEEVTEKKQEVTRLKEEIEQAALAQGPETKTEDKEVEEKTGPENENTKAELEEKKRRAIKEAKAALKKSIGALDNIKNVLDDINKTISSAEKQMADAQSKIGRYENMYNEVQTDPTRASEFLSKL